MPLRVITGSAGGLHLQTPKGVEMRPTQDRVKQAMFSSLGELVIDAVALDLYAGTGALGIEALSRGAAEATFVESNRQCIEVLKKNLHRCKLSGNVVQSDVTEFLKRNPVPKFNLVLADPPYVKDRSKASAQAELEQLRPWLQSTAYIVWEYFSGQQLTSPPWAEILFNRTYGETGVALLRTSHDSG